MPGTSVQFGYNADGHRISQTADGQTVNYLWDAYSAYGDVVLETDDSGVSLAAYTLANGQLISQTRGGAPTYYLSDGQGSTRALADASGAITDTYDYTAFGELYAQTGATENSYLYTGQQFDEATGLYDLRARYYNPALGRFLSQDTAGVLFGNPVELNRYVYAANRPINLSDPSGRMAGYSIANSEVSIKTRVIAGGIGGFVFGGLGAFAVYMLAKQGHCGLGMEEWADSVDPYAFVVGSAAFGGAMGMAMGGLSPFGVAATSAAFAGLSILGASINPNLCTLAIAVIATVGAGLSAAGLGAGINSGNGGIPITPNGFTFGGGALALQAATANVWTLAGTIVAVSAAGATAGQVVGGGSTPPPGGPGVWERANEAMSEEAAAYQEKITGWRGWVYRVTGVKFDGYDPATNTLLDAKSAAETRSWYEFPDAKDFTVDVKATDVLLQGERQMNAIKGMDGVSITWHVADPDVAIGLTVLFQDARIPINVVYTAP